MNFRQAGVILTKDFSQGPKDFLFIWAIVAPVVISLTVSFALGGFLSSQPHMGILDEGNSPLPHMIEKSGAVKVTEYSSLESLKRSVERGSVEAGIVLPQGLESVLASSENFNIRFFVWGSSSAKNRAILQSSLVDALNQFALGEPPINIKSLTVGSEDVKSWEERMLPLLVLMAVFLGGAFLPAGSLIEEKEKGTLRALLTTPTSLSDIMLAKGIMGIVISLFMGVVILLLNGAFGAQPLTLVLMLGLGGMMASEIGLMCGVLLKDITSLFAIWKVGGILLFAPAFVYLFPQIPQWIGKIIPTYYYIAPIVKITQENSGLSDVSQNIFVLIGINLLLIGLLLFLTKRTKGKIV